MLDCRARKITHKRAFIDCREIQIKTATFDTHPG